MTKKEINDMKIRFNSMLEEGRELYQKCLDLADDCESLRAQIQEAEGEDYDGLPLLFGAGFEIHEDGE
jgi:hypothetical protein